VIPGGSSATLNQQRKLTNAGLRTDVSYVKGKHNVKAGAVFQHTFLTEISTSVLPTPFFNSPCLDANNNPVPDITLNDPNQCPGRDFNKTLRLIQTPPSLLRPFWAAST